MLTNDAVDPVAAYEGVEGGGCEVGEGERYRVGVIGIRGDGSEFLAPFEYVGRDALVQSSPEGGAVYCDLRCWW